MPFYFLFFFLCARNAQRIRGLCVNGMYAVNALPVYARTDARAREEDEIKMIPPPSDRQFSNP